MKFARLMIIASLLAASTAVPTLVQAKSVKWSCVALDPSHPFNFTCRPSTSRP